MAGNALTPSMNIMLMRLLTYKCQSITQHARSQKPAAVCSTTATPLLRLIKNN